MKTPPLTLALLSTLGCEDIECRTSLVIDAQRGCVPVWLVSEGARQ